MSRLTRYDPFENNYFPDPFRDPLRSFLRPAQWPFGTGNDFKLDVNETDKEYKIYAEIPGVKKEDIDISVDGNQVSISAEVKKETSSSKENQVCNERYYGSLRRTFSLDNEVDVNKVFAKYDKGILELLLPKKAGGNTRKISIQG